MLTAHEIQGYKDRLEKTKDQLLKEVKIESRPANFGAETADQEDEKADEAEEFTNELATAAVQKERVNAIDAALARIREGKYGICEKCGKEIPKKVLDLVPESQYCDNCK
jgi:DnaK suppressor protein